MSSNADSPVSTTAPASVSSTAMSNADELDGTVFICDNLPFLKSLDDESIDLICIDPPFGKKQTFEGRLRDPLTQEEHRIECELMAAWGVYDAETAYGKGVEFPDQEGTTAKFSDIWSFRTRVYEDWMQELKAVCPGAYWLIHATRHTHSDSIAAYIAFMVERMLEIRRVLKPTGSVYLHCDHEANAYLRQMMDAVFGRGNFRNEITWLRHTSIHGSFQHAPKQWGNLTDTLLFYAKSSATPVKPYRSLSPDEAEEKFNLVDDKGRRYYDDSNHIWNSPGMGARPNQCYEWKGYRNPHPSGWRLTKPRLEEEYRKGNIVIQPDGRLQRRMYEDNFRGTPIGNLWADINPVAGDERTGYPTQKPQALAERIIVSSTNPGDLVLDCFAGCAYVPVAAQLTGRRWIACDMSPRAWTIVRRQFHKHPQLGIVSEGELPNSESEPNVKLRPQLATANRIIKVRGPNQLPVRRTADHPMQIANVRLAEPMYRQKPKETSDQIWEAFVKEWGTGCWYCGRTMSGHRQELHLDHIEPNRRDGSNDDCWNRALACTVCNSNKSDKLTPEATIRRALEDGLIQTDSIHDEVLRGFKARHDWAKLRWETEVKPNKPG